MVPLITPSLTLAKKISTFLPNRFAFNCPASLSCFKLTIEKLRHEEKTPVRARPNSISSSIPNWRKHHASGKIFHGHLCRASLGNVRVFLSRTSIHTWSFRFFWMESMVGRLDEHSTDSCHPRSNRATIWNLVATAICGTWTTKKSRANSGCGLSQRLANWKSS